MTVLNSVIQLKRSKVAILSNFLRPGEWRDI
jgi:hypothetical protein